MSQDEEEESGDHADTHSLSQSEENQEIQQRPIIPVNMQTNTSASIARTQPPHTDHMLMIPRAVTHPRHSRLLQQRI